MQTPTTPSVAGATARTWEASADGTHPHRLGRPPSSGPHPTSWPGSGERIRPEAVKGSSVVETLQRFRRRVLLGEPPARSPTGHRCAAAADRRLAPPSGAHSPGRVSRSPEATPRRPSAFSARRPWWQRPGDGRRSRVSPVSLDPVGRRELLATARRIGWTRPLPATGRSCGGAAIDAPLLQGGRRGPSCPRSADRRRCHSPAAPTGTKKRRITPPLAAPITAEVEIVCSTQSPRQTVLYGRSNSWSPTRYSSATTARFG